MSQPPQWPPAGAGRPGPAGPPFRASAPAQAYRPPPPPPLGADPTAFGAPPPSGQRRTVLLVAAVLLTVLVVGAGAGAYVVLHARRAAPAAVAIRAGGCVRPDPRHPVPTPSAVTASPDPAAGSTPSGRVLGVACGGSGSLGTVLQVLAGSDVRYAEGCPAATDETYATGTGTVCVRNTGTVHPGDVGRGGGVIRVGDCVHAFRTTVAVEVPCSASDYTGVIVARTPTAERCPPSAVEGVAAPDGDVGRVLCLGNGPGILVTGECGPKVVANRVILEQVACTGTAGIRVTARVADQKYCPKGTDATIEDSYALPAKQIVCVQKL